MKQNFMKKTKVRLDVYEECKYTATKEVFENCKKITYYNVIAFEVITGEEAEQIENETDGSYIDDLHEYLKIYMLDGNIATFRNSYVDLFMI